MRSPVLYFFLLVLGVLLNFTPDVVYKHSRFSQTFSEKGFKFVSYERSGPVLFDMGFMLLPAEVNSISEERGCKKNMFIAFGPSDFEMVLELLAEIVTFYMQIPKV